MTTNNKIIFWTAAIVIVLVAVGFTYSMVQRSGKGGGASSVSGKLVDTGVEVTSTAQAAADPTSVFRLDLRHQGLTAIPASVFQMSNLVLLNLAGNNLTSVPPEIGNLKDLQVLYLNQNPQITSLPDVFGNLTDLKMLSLFGDGLTTIPPSIMNLTGLKYLGLSGNPIPPTTIVQLRKELPNTTIN
ncbi:MAG: leucine-rich repeat domain-containing protein [Minisyncoccia bacterium]|jgi:Leucine-rich repeat (LRR) protein